MYCGNECNEQSGRSFLTRGEKIAKLKDYKDWLDNESKGVEEAIVELNKAG